MVPNAFEDLPKRDIQVNFQLSAEEKKALDAAVSASNLSMAAYLRAAIREKMKRESGEKPKKRT